MKKRLFSIPLCLVFTVTSAVSQESGTSASQIEYKPYLSFGLSGGVSTNTNAYKLVPDVSEEFTYYGMNPHGSFGLDVSAYLSEKMRARLEYRYLQMSYGMNWSNDYPTFDKTVVILYESNLSLHFDYAFLNTERFQVFVSPALLYEFVIGDDFRNTLADGSVNYKNYSILEKNYPPGIVGGNLSAILKYNLRDFIGITLTPNYTWFFRNFMLSNDKPYQRFGLNLGFEITLR